MKMTKILAAGLLALVTTAANASTVFTPTDGDVNFLFGNVAGYDLYMFDDADIGNEQDAATKLFIDVPEIVGIVGPIGGGDYIATNEAAETLVLTGSANFFLALYDIANDVWLRDNSVTAEGANAYSVAFQNQSGEFLVIDVAVADVPSVPVPAAAWLFGSGLIGLVGIARRRV